MPRLFLRIFFDGLMLGPGKVELLERIRASGSIAAAGRQMGMSYRRAWSLVEEMNAAFADPVVTSTRGGPGGGGAEVTATGEAVIAHYHAAHAAALKAGAADIAALADMVSGRR
ncbi:MAG: LysR family transcriptional regulator [Rubellimicrobium sp.]|nr:LysR family transcriptional regulator [Rubellimicrobium sp.]